MYRLKVEEYKLLLESYQTCLGIYFPDLKIECFESEFVINEQCLQYIDIVGILVANAYLIIKMKNRYHIHLPIQQNAEYYAQKHSKSDEQMLFMIWNNDNMRS